MDLISGAQLRDWVTRLMADRAVIAPVQAGEDLVLYQPIEATDAMTLEFTRTALSPKEFFLPATEAILTIERIKNAAAGDDGAGPDWQVQVAAGQLERDQVLFGIRPCDTHALAVLDALLLQEPVDSYYAERRQRTVLVGLACAEMGPSCFCTNMGLAPDNSDGMDVMLYPLPDRPGDYGMRALTDKGRELMAGLTTESGPDWVAPEWPAPAPSAVAPRAVWTQLFDDPYWGHLADRCLTCKICTYVCPTCRCFDVRDYTTAQGPGYEKIERLRCWDSCLSEGYRRAAGGHNPRPTKGQRLRNRFYCKFDYYPADFGPVACVGCGRCVEACPVNVDITEVLQEVSSRE